MLDLGKFIGLLLNTPILYKKCIKNESIKICEKMIKYKMRLIAKMRAIKVKKSTSKIELFRIFFFKKRQNN